MSVAAAISTDPSPYIVGQVYDIDPAVLTIGTNVRLDTHSSAREFAASINGVDPVWWTSVKRRSGPLWRGGSRR